MECIFGQKKSQMWGPLLPWCANYSRVLLHSVFIKILNLLQFEIIDSKQAIKSLPSQTWQIKLLKNMRRHRKNIIVYAWHNSPLFVHIWLFDYSIFFFGRILRAHWKMPFFLFVMKIPKWLGLYTTVRNKVIVEQSNHA